MKFNRRLTRLSLCNYVRAQGGKPADLSINNFRIHGSFPHLHSQKLAVRMMRFHDVPMTVNCANLQR
jgi:hypothetical protein